MIFIFSIFISSFGWWLAMVLKIKSFFHSLMVKRMLHTRHVASSNLAGPKNI